MAAVILSFIPLTSSSFSSAKRRSLSLSHWYEVAPRHDSAIRRSEVMIQ